MLFPFDTTLASMPQQMLALNSLEALSDQASGWFTLVDKFGTAYAEKLPNLHLVPSCWNCSILFQEFVWII